MRKFLTALLLAGATVFVAAEEPKKADEKKPEEKKVEAPKKRQQKEPSLKVGDKAPTLKADKWLQGDEVKEFASGKIYVVEFWATWCGPCIVMMPHMSEMQAEFKDKGVTFIGYSKADDNNSAEKVAEFVKKRGPKLGYTFAFSEEPDVYESWMTAAGQGGIPCCFVVDRAGSIAYIGHPMFLDVVLPKVVDGSWKNDTGVKELDVVEKEVDAVFASFNKSNPEETLKTLAAFEAKYPRLNKIPYFVSPKLATMLKAKKYEDVKLLARNLISRGVKGGDDSLLGQVSAALRGPDAKGQKALLELSVKAADEALKLAGEKDLRSLLGVAQASFAVGDKAKGKEYATKALEAAEARAKTNVAFTLASSAIGAGEKAIGLEFAEKAIDGAPAAQKAMLMANVAGILVRAGDKPGGDEYAKKAVEAASGTGKASVYAALAQTYLIAREKKIGDEYAKQALETAMSESAKASILVGLAQAYYAADEKATAKDYATKAIEAAPANAKANYRRALQRILNDGD